MKMHKIFILLAVLLATGAGCVSLSGNKTGTSGQAGIYVSTDSGDSWTHLTALPEADGVKSIENVNVYRLFNDPQDPDAFYLGTRGQGMYFTYDSGKTWQKPMDPALQNGFIYSVAVHPKDSCNIYATNGTQVFKSIDCNRSWKEVYRETRSNITLKSLAFESFSPYRIYIGASNGDLLESLDTGKSWTVVHRFDDDLVSVNPDPFVQGRLYVATKASGIFRTVNLGQTWENLNKGMSQFSGSLDYKGFVFHPTKQNTIYWLSIYGILYTLDGGNIWDKIDLITPEGSVNIYTFGVNPENDKEMYYTATLKDLSRSTFYKSIDGGVNWTTKKLPTGQVPAKMRIHPEKNYIYIGFAIPPKS
jgi:photosystem II stability/assembly factor-like uncharacterized protein